MSSASCAFDLKGTRGAIKFIRFAGEYVDCSWAITAPLYHKIRLKFSNFQLPQGSIQVYDGSSANSTLLGKFTGTFTQPFSAQSTGRIMFVTLQKEICVWYVPCIIEGEYFASTLIGEISLCYTKTTVHRAT